MPTQLHSLHRNMRRYHLGDYPADSKNGLLNNLEAYWKLEESSSTRNDSTANGRNLTSLPGNCGTNTGIIGNANNTTAGANKLDLRTSSSQSTFWPNIQSGDSFSISTWVKFNAVPSTQFHGVVSFWNSSVISYFLWFNGNSTLQLLMVNAANTTTVTSSVLAPPSSGTWYHIIFGYDNAASQMFWRLNGGARTNSSITGVFKQTTGTCVFELMDYAGSTSPPDMTMDETGWWRRALSDTDAALLYNGGLGTPYGSFTT